jgi:hypothetical protein
MAKEIRQYIRSSIKLDELQQTEINTGLGDNLKGMASADQAKFFGYKYPLIKINNQPLNEYVNYFQMDFKSRIPQVIINYTPPASGVFLSGSFPKDGDLISVYLRAAIPAYKPIRIDFLVTEVSGIPITYGIYQTSASYGINQDFTIMGEMRIPSLYSSISKNFDRMSSIEVLREVASDLGLGFSTNVGSTDDKMNWICPMDSYHMFINDVVSCSWLDEKSSFDWWIDPYYNLTFVDVSEQTRSPYPANEFVIIPFSDLGNDDSNYYGQNLSTVKVNARFSNDSFNEHLPFKIKEFTVLNNAGNINLDYGYIQKVSFFDPWIDDSFVSWNLEVPYGPDPSERKIGFKGRFQENLYQREIKSTYLGIANLNPDDNGAIHQNFYEAKVKNIFYRDQLKKLILRIELSSYVIFSLYKGMNIPVDILTAPGSVGQLETVLSPNQIESFNTNVSTIDFFLSGNYMISGFDIIWTRDGGFKYILDLVRSDWTVNSGYGSYTRPVPIQDPSIRI